MLNNLNNGGYMLTQQQQKKRFITINNIDVLYRDIESIEHQFEIMQDILNCLDDNELSAIKKRIKEKLKLQKRGEI